MIYITGDTHGRFERIESFCQMNSTSKDDIMIILGDAGINFSGLMYDSLKKKLLEELPITIFSIHGNHEQRPYTIDGYKENNGMVAQYMLRMNIRVFYLQKMERYLI